MHQHIRMIPLRASNAYVKLALMDHSAKKLYQTHAMLIVEVAHVESVMIKNVSAPKAGMESNAKSAPKIRSAIHQTMAELVISIQVDVNANLVSKGMHNVLQKVGIHVIRSIAEPMGNVLMENACA